MVGSAQLKVVLENSWNLESFDTHDVLSRARIIVKRSHLQPEIRHNRSR
jgi:hypothetical protein